MDSARKSLLERAYSQGFHAGADRSGKRAKARALDSDPEMLRAWKRGRQDGDRAAHAAAKAYHAALDELTCKRCGGPTEPGAGDCAACVVPYALQYACPSCDDAGHIELNSNPTRNARCSSCGWVGTSSEAALAAEEVNHAR